MEINKNYLQQKYTINNLGKPAIQIQNFFRVDHNIKHINCICHYAVKDKDDFVEMEIDNNS